MSIDPWRRHSVATADKILPWLANRIVEEAALVDSARVSNDCQQLQLLSYLR